MIQLDSSGLENNNLVYDIPGYPGGNIFEKTLKVVLK